MAFTPDGIYPHQAFPCLAVHLPTTMRYRTVFGGDIYAIYTAMYICICTVDHARSKAQKHVPHNLSVMQSSQLDTASPAQDGSHSHTARNFLRPRRVYDCLSYRGKFATVEQLQLSVLKRGKKSQRLQTRSIAFAQWKKRLEHFFENRGGDIFLNEWATIYMCYSKLQQNNLFEITQDSPTFLRHPVNSHRSILMLPLFPEI